MTTASTRLPPGTRRPSVSCLALVLLTGQLSGFVRLAAEQPVRAAQDRPGKAEPLAKLKVKDLIDKLQAESQEGIGSHSTAWVSGFLAIDQEPHFEGGVLGFREPRTSPVMRELVRRGVAALPDLIDHLNDKRPTKLVITHAAGFGDMWCSDEYDPRSADPKKRPTGVNTGLETSKGLNKARLADTKYTLRVGDLCYVAVGQIVNRRLHAVRYQPTACVVINSPVQTPTLAAAVKRDWAGLTAEEHKQSLTQDALSKYPDATAAAMVRLVFYYPAAGEALALKLLARALYEDGPLWDFITERLVKANDPVKWKAMIEEFRKVQGQAAVDALPFRLHWICWLTRVERDKAFRERRRRAAKILAQLYPSYDRYTPSFINAATPDEQRALINSLAQHPSGKVDQAVHRGFQAAARMKTTDDEGRIELDGLAFACMSRLVGKGHDQAFREFVAGRIKAAEALPADSDGRRSLEALRYWQRRLK
jgi:hypothetical protein